MRTAVVQANYDWTYVRVHAQDGQYGTGECFQAPGLTAIIADLAPLLVGEDARDVDRLWAKLRWAASGMSVPFWEALAAGRDRPVIEDGWITVTEAPGIGVELDEAVARRYAKPGEPFFGEPAG